MNKLHWTMTGPMAGTPFCEVDKLAAIDRGERFVHYVYANLDDPDTCTECREALAAAEDDA